MVAGGESGVCEGEWERRRGRAEPIVRHMTSGANVEKVREHRRKKEFTREGYRRRRVEGVRETRKEKCDPTTLGSPYGPCHLLYPKETDQFRLLFDPS